MKPYSDTVQRTAKRGVGSAKKKKAAVQKSIAKVSAMRKLKNNSHKGTFLPAALLTGL